ncbi:MAG: MFS transporter [Candidatus Hodarchaeota archaeon]
MPIEKNESEFIRSKTYFKYMIFILIFVEILDTYTTNYPNVIPSQVISEFLLDYPENIAQSIFAIVIGIATVGMYFVFLNQYLADRVGRKLLLGFTVFGMALSSFLILLSTNIIQYTIFLFMLYIFFSSDIWVIYINEESPPEKRAFWTNIVLIGGVAGAILIPIFRSIFITETFSYWRGMTLFAIFLGIPLALIIFFTFKETSKYEQIKEGKLKEKKTPNLFKDNMRSLFKSSRRKEFIIILIMSFIGGLNYIFIALGESFVSSSPNLTQNDINIIVLVMSLAAIAGYLITGIFADKLGRKPFLYIYSILLPISILIAVLGSYVTEGALLYVCIGAGLGSLAYWGLRIVISIVTLEIIPTEARGTGNGLKSLIAAIGITGGLLLSSIIIFYYGLGFAFILYSLFLLIDVPLIYLYIKETKGIDLSKIQ